MRKQCLGAAFAVTLAIPAAHAETLIGSGPRLNPADRLSQEQIASGNLTLTQIRQAGLLIFSTPFNKADGYGDGPHDPSQPDNRSPQAGNRPTLQGNGTFLRVNGLDAQTCLECHTIVSNATVPAQFGVGGVGGINNSPMFQPDFIDVADGDNDGVAEFTGRLINPPFLFGSGGVEQLGREMTADLQELKQRALEQPGTVIPLETKGVYFGTLVADAAGNLDTSQVQGVDEDLVVRPFGRKGDQPAVRDFDVAAMAFHMGMQAVEAFGGPDADLDNDGVRNEISVGDLSALSIFNTTMDRPFREKLTNSPAADRGFQNFRDIGCAECHRPVLQTESPFLLYKLAGSPEQPFANPFYRVDLRTAPMQFEANQSGGVRVELFADLKRHDMGEGLQETFNLAGDQGNREFTTARLWGVADTAPYLHDGRAQTLEEAIRMHDSPGSEAAFAAQNFAALTTAEKNEVLAFLHTLRTPRRPNADVTP